MTDKISLILKGSILYNYNSNYQCYNLPTDREKVELEKLGLKYKISHPDYLLLEDRNGCNYLIPIKSNNIINFLERDTIVYSQSGIIKLDSLENFKIRDKYDILMLFYYFKDHSLAKDIDQELLFVKKNGQPIYLNTNNNIRICELNKLCPDNRYNNWNCLNSCNYLVINGLEKVQFLLNSIFTSKEESGEINEN